VCSSDLHSTLNDASRIDQLRDTIISYEKKVGEDSKPGLWGRAFDLLLGNRRSGVTDEQQSSIIKDLEERLERLSDTGKENILGRVSRLREQA